MPPRHVNGRASAQADVISSALPVPPRRVNIPDESVGPLMEAMEETLAKPACSVVAETGKRASSGVSGRFPKKGLGNYSSGSGSRRGSRSSQPKQ
ncbi:hypothetical protein PVK06_040553 [Gossypium arboreum]|uniref:Uncharacterized protein n=1 Tax=Gossypium arboreum TaxID=29729 RepID=A0ABR0N613_GOSAR|nr:hypothetical protein PVK06_040553 [Gossypium arboreum]